MSIIVDFNPRQEKALSALEEVKREFMSNVYEAMTNLENLVDEQEKELEIREARILPFKTYKTKEAAALLQIGAQSLTSLANRNEIPCSKIGRAFVFRESELIELQIRAERGEVNLSILEGENNG